MRILNIHNHEPCKNYMNNGSLGFSHHLHNKDQTIPLLPRHIKHLIFVLSGEISVTMDEYKDKVVVGGEMILVYYFVNCHMKTLSDTELIILTYDIPTQMCDMVMMQEMSMNAEKTDYQFVTTEIREPLTLLLNSIIYYLDSGVRCRHLHSAKEKELFVIFKHFYNNAELITLFHRSLHRHTIFKGLVLSNYNKARNASELATLCGYGTTNFHKLFKIHFQDSPYKWLVQQSVLDIKSKLLDPNIPIKQIVAEFDFSSASHFNTYCKRHFGATASQVRGTKRGQSAPILGSYNDKNEQM